MSLARVPLNENIQGFGESWRATCTMTTCSWSIGRILISWLKFFKSWKFVLRRFSRLDCNLLVAKKTLLLPSAELVWRPAIAERFESRQLYLAHILVYLDSNSRSSISSLANGSINLETKLQNYLESAPSTNENDSDLEKLMSKAELKGFKQTKIRGKFLQFTYEQVKQIKVSTWRECFSHWVWWSPSSDRD